MLTPCSTKREPYGPQDVAHFARKRAHASIGPRNKDHNKTISDTYALQHQEWAIQARRCGIFRKQGAHTSVGPLGKDHDKTISDTYVLQTQE
jgi:hypothetical protein